MDIRQVARDREAMAIQVKHHQPHTSLRDKRVLARMAIRLDSTVRRTKPRAHRDNTTLRAGPKASLDPTTLRTLPRAPMGNTALQVRSRAHLDNTIQQASPKIITARVATAHTTVSLRMDSHHSPVNPVTGNRTNLILPPNLKTTMEDQTPHHPFTVSKVPHIHIRRSLKAPDTANIHLTIRRASSIHHTRRRASSTLPTRRPTRSLVSRAVTTPTLLLHHP